jgi:hypothetical protein
MRVDSFRFLPRSFRPLYEHVDAPQGEMPWTPFAPRLAAASIALLTSAGLHLEGVQPASTSSASAASPPGAIPRGGVSPPG